jgi:hypothetical protein
MLIHYFIILFYMVGFFFLLFFPREVHVPHAACNMFFYCLRKTSWVILLINNIYSLSMSATKMATCIYIYIYIYIYNTSYIFFATKSFWKTFQSCEWKYYFNIFITQSKNLNTLLGNWIFFFTVLITKLIGNK